MWVVQRAVVRHLAQHGHVGGVPHHRPLNDPRALPGLRLLLKQWELDVQDPTKSALGPDFDVERAGAIHFGPTRLGLVEF